MNHSYRWTIVAIGAPAFFHQQQRRNGRDRLGHRIDLEDCVAAHRRAARNVAISESLPLHDATAPGDECDRTGVLPLVDGGLQIIGHALETERVAERGAGQKLVVMV